VRRNYLAAIALTACGAIALSAQAPRPPGSSRTELQRHDLSMAGHEAVQLRVDFAPGGSFPRHKHPGEEIIYIIEGSIEYKVDGQPPMTLKAGEVLFVQDGAIHSARNVGDVPAAELGTYVVKKGRPLTEIVG
jgi:quercetin dioxygenase-like cupin family protein